MVASAEVRLSTDTSMVGGSAHRCVADNPSRPAGPLSERAVTMVLPVARWPIACQNCLPSIVPALSGMIIHHFCDGDLRRPSTLPRTWDGGRRQTRLNCMRMQTILQKV
jgi:hypothetical protein